MGDIPHVPATGMVELFVSNLATAHWGSEAHRVPHWVRDVGSELKQNPLIFRDDSLASMVGRLSSLQSLGLRVSFLTMINNIQVLTKCIR